MRCPPLLLLGLLAVSLALVAADVTIMSPDNTVSVDFVGSSQWHCSGCEDSSRRVRVHRGRCGVAEACTLTAVCLHLWSRSSSVRRSNQAVPELRHQQVHQDQGAQKRQQWWQQQRGLMDHLSCVRLLFVSLSLSLSHLSVDEVGGGDCCRCESAERGWFRVQELRVDRTRIRHGAGEGGHKGHAAIRSQCQTDRHTEQARDGVLRALWLTRGLMLWLARVQIKDGKNTASPHFNVSAYLFREEVALADGSSTVTVPANNIKFSIGVDGWPFESTSNFLLFGAEVDTPKADTGSKDASGSDSSKTKIAFGESNIVLQNSAIADGVQVSISSTVSDKHIDWKFPAFQNRLDYDPTIGYADSGAAAIAPTVTVALIALLATAVSILMQ